MNNNKLYKMLSINGDLLTPVGIFKRLQGNKKFLLESSYQHETKGKYSFIGANPIQEIIGSNDNTTVVNLMNNKKETYHQHALDYIKRNFPKFDIPIPFPFSGGAVGYVGYDTVRQFISIGPDLPDELHMPDIHFMVYDTIIVYEHRTETAHIVTVKLNGETDSELHERLIQIEEQLDEQTTINYAEENELHFKPNISKEKFMNKVEKAQQLLHDENIDQIVLSQRMVAQLDGDPFSFYRNLRIANPSPYMFYIDFKNYIIVGASPESLVQTTNRSVITNPIAGTRPRGKTELEDIRISEELLADKKEVAEHDMLVTLSKKDLEKICATDTIHVPIYKKVEKYEHVMHIVTEVHGELREDVTSIDALITCLPAGTVSGAPRQRAMQIINDLENMKRGVYAGGIGYVTFNHDINLAIAIRSLVIKDEKAYLQVGAGIVTDSVPEKEYEETLHKAKSLTNINNIRQLN